MAIDNTGISSLDAGASDITYSGNEGPKSPQQEQQMQQQQQMATLVQEYKDYAMSQEEAGRPVMPFEEWVRSMQSPMAYGGSAHPTYTQSRKQRMAYGGVAGLDGRRQYGLGSWFQEKVMDPIKKVIPNEIKNPAALAALGGGALNQWGLPFDIKTLGLEKGAGENWLGDLLGGRDAVFGKGADITFDPTGETSGVDRKKLIDLGGIFGGDSAVKKELERIVGTSGAPGGGNPGMFYNAPDDPGFSWKKALATILPGGDPGYNLGSEIFRSGTKDKANWMGPVTMGLGIGALDAATRKKDMLPQDTSGIDQADIRRRAKIGSDPGLHFLPPASATKEYAQGGRTGYANGYEVQPAAYIKPEFTKEQPFYNEPLDFHQGGLRNLTLYQLGSSKLQDLYKNLRSKDMTVGQLLEELQTGKYDELPENITSDLKEHVLKKVDFGDTFQENWSMGTVEPTFKDNRLDIEAGDLETEEMPVRPEDVLELAHGGRIRAQEGGLMNLGGMEKDYRQEGGFVPLGGEERADDVPARLSKNEFVFTADAVRAAGGGDIDAGAEIMENLMNNLEQGGQVSEESQGREGARDMFATSQRLEGVM
jgi:hypothetical protein